MTEPEAGASDARAVVVIPCYDEADRLDRAEVESLLRDGTVNVLFVDDGSSDGTGQLLETLRSLHADQVRVHTLASNGGKAEAVRQGMLAALDAPCEYIGYLDADFATPASEYRRLLTILSESSAVSAVLGARVAMLGTRVERRAARHYVGRIFATGASVVLGVHVYDTQCGAKIFRASPRLRDALGDPFESRWAFDVELLSRLTMRGFASPPLDVSELVEVPLQDWHDVAGSKVSAFDAVRMAKDLATIWRQRRRAELRVRRSLDAP